jgi:hypothetical protein
MMLHPLLKNMLQTTDQFKIPCPGAPFSWLEKPRNSMRMRSEFNSMFCWEKVDQWNPIQSRSHPMQFLGFSNHEKGTPGKKF